MDRQLSPETEVALRKLAREVGRSSRLNADTIEELYGHLEDKTIGFLSGEEGLSEADAVILTREHFGDPGAFPELHAAAKPFKDPASLQRSLAAIAVSTVAVSAAIDALKLLIAVGIGAQSALHFFSFQGMPWLYSLLAFKACVLCMLMRRWNARIRQGLPVWYQRWSSSGIAFALLVLVLLHASIPSVRIAPEILTPAYLDFLHDALEMSFVARYFYFLVGPVLLGLLPLLWIWWADCRVRRIKAIAAASFAFVVLSVGMTIPSMFLGDPAYVVGVSRATFEVQPNFDLAPFEAPVAVSAFQKSFGLSPDRRVATAVAFIGYEAAITAIVTLIAALAYILLAIAVRACKRYGRLEIRLKPATR